MNRYEIKFDYKKMKNNDEYDIVTTTRAIYAFNYEDACYKLKHIHLGACNFKLLN